VCYKTFGIGDYAASDIKTNLKIRPCEKKEPPWNVAPFADFQEF
jgi:hypothetical protein